MLPTINLLVLRSPDIHRSVRFYEALGLVFLSEQHGSGPEHYSSMVNGFVFELYPLGTAIPTAGLRFGFNVAEVDDLVVAVRDLGAAILTAPQNSEWGRRAVVCDLDGHIVELITPPGRDQSNRLG